MILVTELRRLLLGIDRILVAVLLTYWLWNLLIPDIFGLQVITFWQALGLWTLAGAILSSARPQSLGRFAS